jgi:PAS domain S-box-containing protein
MNSSGLAMVGADSAEVAVGRSVFDLIAPNDLAKFREFHQRICRGDNDSLEFDVVTLHGKLRHMETYAAPFRMPDGQIAQLAVTRDVTDRKSIEERERQMTAEAIAATAKFRAVFEQTTVFACIMTTDGIVTEANRLSLDACGYRAEDVLGRLFWETGWWQGSKEVQEKIRAATRQAAEGTPYRETLTYYWADGTERLVDFGLHPIRNDRGEIIYLHPTGVDITDIKNAETKYRTLSETLESQVQSRTEELEERNREVQLQSEQLRLLSHRLIQIQDSERRRIARELHDSAGQVLTALGMNLATVAHYAKGTTPQLAEIAAEGQSLVRELSQEIRTMSYLLHPPLLDENGLPEALRWYIQGLKERSGLEVSLTIPEDFGRVPRDMELVIFRIVQEGLTNIHRHSGSNVAKIRIARESRRVLLEVEDQGKGMTPEKLAEIQTRGTGVGLRGMRERVLQLGGKMNIRSNAGGTTILISLPFEAPEQSSVKGSIPSSRPVVERARG